MRIVVLDGHALNPGDNPWTDLATLGDLAVYDRVTADEIIPKAAGAQVVLTNKTPLTEQTLAKLPDLRFISVLATGYNVVDVEAARRRGIPVSNVPVYGTDSVAQFVFALLLELCHHVASHSEQVHAGEWAKSEDFCFWSTPLTELAGMTMGLLGFGRIGRRVGELAHAFGMSVHAYDPFPGDAPPYKPFEWKGVEEVFTEADLAAALNEGRIAGAAVDVVSEEPIRPDNPLLGAANCLVTPHIAWATLAARRRLMRTTAENVAAFIAGSPINVVN